MTHTPSAYIQQIRSDHKCSILYSLCLSNPSLRSCGERWSSPASRPPPLVHNQRSLATYAKDHLAERSSDSRTVHHGRHWRETGNECGGVKTSRMVAWPAQPRHTLETANYASARATNAHHPPPYPQLEGAAQWREELERKRDVFTQERRL